MKTPSIQVLIGLVVAGCLFSTHCARAPQSQTKEAAIYQEPLLPMNDSLVNIYNDISKTEEEKIGNWFANGKYDSMQMYYERWLPIRKSMMSYRPDSTNKYNYFGVLGTLGNMQSLTGDLENGLQNLLVAMTALEKDFPVDELLLDGCVGIASNYALRGDYETAVYWQYRGIEFSGKLFPPEHPVYGNWYFNIGYFRSRQGDYNRALESYLKSAEIFNSSWYKAKLAQTYERLADVERHLGAYKEAQRFIDMGKSALKVSQQPEEDKIMLMLGYAALKLDLNDMASVNACLDHVEKELSKINPEKSSVWADYFTIRGDAALEQGQYDEAIQYYQQAITGNSRHMVQCFKVESQGRGQIQNLEIQNKIAETYLKKADPENALNTINSILSGTSGAFNGDLHSKNPDLNDLPHGVVFITTLHMKARANEQIYNRSGNTIEMNRCLDAYRFAIAFIDQLNQNLRWENSKFTLLNRAIPLYEDAIAFLIDLSGKQNNTQFIEEAWVLADKCKAVTLLEKLESTEEKRFGAIPDSLLIRQKMLHQDISFLEQQIMTCEYDMEGKKGQKLVEYRARLLSAKDQYDSLLSAIKLNNSNFYRFKYNSVPVSWAKMQSKILTPGGALIEFFEGDSAIYTFCLDSDGIRFHKEKTDSALYAGIRNLTTMKECTQCANFTHFVQNSRMLFTRLLEPVLPARQSVGKLVIIPDGPLGYLPFHLLLEREPDGDALAAEDWRSLPYLLKTKIIRYEYSAALLLEKPLRKMRRHFYAGFAPTFSGEALTSRGQDSAIITRNWQDGIVPGLKNNLPEVQSIGEITHGQCFLSDEATEQAFKANAPGNGVIHLATHACTDDTDPLYSQILFSQMPGDTSEDGSLHAYELYNMRLDADLAVLSACQTGAGKIQRGEGIMSLSRAFKYAGCPNIVMSLWNADDATSKDIMVQFFKNLKDGLGKDEALRKAQLDFLKNAPQETAYPGYWATFVLVGDDAPVSFSSGKWLIVLAAAGMTGLIIYFFFGKQKKSLQG